MTCCERGRSMIEMLGVLAIVGVLSVGGIAGYTKAMKKIRSEKTAEQINELVMNIRRTFINQDGFEGINQQLLIDAGAVPVSMYDPAQPSKTLTNAFGGEVYIFESVDISDKPRAFELYVTGLDKETCVMVSTLDWGIDPSTGFMSLYVGVHDDSNPIAEQDSTPMRDIVSPDSQNPSQGIFTAGQHEGAIPITIPVATSVCTCSQTDCIIGLKYS